MLPLCYNHIMKKVTRDELVKLLKNKHCSYQELSIITGYHPKSLIRINFMIKNGSYKISSKNSMIINDFLNSTYKAYKDFYDAYKNKYNISYSTLCRTLKNAYLDKEIVLIKKIREKENTHFIVTDYKTQSLLFKFNSTRNDNKSIKEILFRVLTDFGAPNNICFVNFKINLFIIDILNKYHINILQNNSLITKSFKYIKIFEGISYRKCQIDFQDFYNRVKRRTIATSTIQFNNTRYKIVSDKNIKKNTGVIVYYDDNKSHIFVRIKGKMYKIIPHKLLKSKKGLTKY